MIQEIEFVELKLSNLNKEYEELHQKYDAVKKEQRENSRKLSYMKGQLSVYNRLDGKEYIMQRTNSFQTFQKQSVPEMTPARGLLSSGKDEEISKPPMADRPWSDSEREYVRAHYTKIPTPDIANTLGRTEGAIKCVASQLGVANYRATRQLNRGF